MVEVTADFPRGRSRIVVVEDDQAYRYAVDRALRAEGHLTASFSSPPEFRHALQSGLAPDVLVTDLNFEPGMMHGVELARSAVAHRRN